MSGNSLVSAGPQPHGPRHSGCDCHPWIEDDHRIWSIVRKSKRTKEQWKRLHDMIEGYRYSLIEDYRSAQLSAGEKGGA